jgi:alpha-beta hydrolase superfamily lysophospholipase
MHHAEQTLETPDGTRLHVERWTPDEVRFVVAVSHGGAEHVGRYERLARELGARGGLVFGADHRGQGRSGGPKGHVDRFETYAGDLRHVMLETAAALPESARPQAVPWFLFGHSMGGLIALVYLLDRARDVPLRGGIVSAPLLGLTMKVNPIKLAVGKLAARLVPRLTLPSGIPPESICRDAEVVRRYLADERRADVVSAGWFAAMNEAITRVSHEAAGLELPMLWYLGTGDRICDRHATERVFASMTRAEARDQTLRRFDGYYHELHNEPDDLRAPVVAMLLEWIEHRLSDPDAT